MTGIDFLSDIHHAYDFSIHGRQFIRTDIIYDNFYYGRLHGSFMFPDHDEKFTTWIYESKEKLGMMFTMVYTVKLHVSDVNHTRKAIEVTGQLSSGKMNIDISHDLMENYKLYGGDVVNEVIKEIRYHLIHEATICLYDADTDNVLNHVLGEMTKDESKRDQLERIAYNHMLKSNFKR